MADDVFAELERLRREEGLGPSEALNLLARRGMRRTTGTPRPAYVHSAEPLGLRVDVSDIGAVLELIDET